MKTHISLVFKIISNVNGIDLTTNSWAKPNSLDLVNGRHSSNKDVIDLKCVLYGGWIFQHFVHHDINKLMDPYNLMNAHCM